MLFFSSARMSQGEGVELPQELNNTEMQLGGATPCRREWDLIGRLG